MASLFTLLFIAREKDTSRTVPLEITQTSFSEQCTSSVFYMYSLYLTIQYFRGHLSVSKRTLSHVFIVCFVFTVVSSSADGLIGCLALIGCVMFSIVWLPCRRLSVCKKAVLITGCDRGIGHSLAIHLDRLGFYVFAGFLDPSGASHEDVLRRCSDRLRTIRLDVSKSEEVEQAKTYISKELLETDVVFWGVVNNAGICYIGNVEMMCYEDMNKIMAVNYFGPVHVCKAMLPLLRKSSGRIVNIASNAGLAPVPLMGVYCASKAALASMTEVWRYEFQMWGIKVATVIPSGYKTGIVAYDKARTAEKWWSLASDVVKQDYGKECFDIKFKQKNHETMLSANFTEIQNNVADALLSVSPDTYYYNGFLARTIPFLYLHLPTALGDPIIRLLTDWFEFKPCSLTETRKSNRA